MTALPPHTRPRLGISTCLTGEPVRYEGGHKRDSYLMDTLGKHVDWVAVCPEVECGLSVPREAMHLAGDPEHPRLVTVQSSADLTDRMQQWAATRVHELEPEDLCGYVFKSKSPSCGLFRVKVYPEAGGPPRNGAGIFAAAFAARFPLLPLEEEGRLQDTGLRTNFLTRVFAVRRWKDYCRDDSSRGGLVAFHAAHKYLIMAHNPRGVSALGRIVATMKGRSLAQVQQAYFALLMDTLHSQATVSRTTNVLQHMAGYVRGHVSTDERRELAEEIERYRSGVSVLAAPVTLLKHYIRKYRIEYLAGQWFFSPYPEDL
jgi:uncharacterized protein YbgA (DUF1722 family)/uncharacterized protein YbbK (DUF523 family)